MDVLADIVSRLAIRSQRYFRAELCAPFAVSVPEDRECIRFHVATRGRCWIGVENGDAAYFDEGSVALVPHGAAHILASEPTSLAPSLASVRDGPRARGSVLRLGAGALGAELVCGHFAFGERALDPLQGSLPTLLCVNPVRRGGFAWIAPLLEALEARCEVDDDAAKEIERRLSEILFLELLRAASECAREFRGLLGALADPCLSRALRAMHEDPASDWALDALARTAGTSRSVFAERFRTRVGTTPMRYLAQLRIDRARSLLARRERSVGEIAREVGYASEAAFNRAFRQIVGEPPGRFRRAPVPDARARASDATPHPAPEAGHR